MTSFPDFMWAEIRKEFGEHCMRRKDYKKANENFAASLKWQEDKLDSVYCLAKSQACGAEPDDAERLLKEKKDLGLIIIRIT